MRTRAITAAIAAFCTAVLAACGSSGDNGSGTTVTTSPVITTVNEPPETTVEIDGNSYTCEQITDSGDNKCGPNTQAAFDRYKENIETYAQSGKLGAFNGQNPDIYYEDAAFAGLVACAIAANSDNPETAQNEYIDTMLDDPRLGKLLPERTTYLPTWFAAAEFLCPDISEKFYGSMNPGSVIIP